MTVGGWVGVPTFPEDEVVVTEANFSLGVCLFGEHQHTGVEGRGKKELFTGKNQPVGTQVP